MSCGEVGIGLEERSGEGGVGVAGLRSRPAYDEAANKRYDRLQPLWILWYYLRVWCKLKLVSPG